METSIHPASSSMALKALAPSTLFQMPDPKPDDFYEMAELVKNLPCYVLKLGTEISGIAPAISNFLSQRLETCAIHSK